MRHKSRDLGIELVGMMIREQIRPGIIAEMYEAGCGQKMCWQSLYSCGGDVDT